MQHDPRRANVFERLLLAALVFYQLQNAADIFFIAQNRGQNYGFLNLGDLARIGPARGVVHFNQGPIGLGNFVAYAGCSGNEFEREFALQPLLNDLHVQQAEKPASESET